jgi:hypothetical protein
MKANPRLRFAAIATLATASLLAVSCSEPPPAPAPTPAPAPAPPPPPRLPSSDLDWRTAPITPGDWVWSMEGGLSIARFAGGQLVLTCDRSANTVTLARRASATGPVAMTITTSKAVRPVTASPQPGSPSTIAVAFPARDPILDAMAFSRGRFMLESAGLPPLIVPSWPEISRVIEDCR